MATYTKTESTRKWRNFKESDLSDSAFIDKDIKCELGENNSEQPNYFSQKYPFNAFTQDAQITLDQIIKTDLVIPIVGTSEDLYNGNIGEFIVDVLLPPQYHAIASWVGKLWKRKKKKGEATQQGLPVAGCSIISLLNLFWNYRHYPVVQKEFSGIENIPFQISYDGNERRINKQIIDINKEKDKKEWNDAVSTIKKTTLKIYKNYVGSFLAYEGMNETSGHIKVDEVRSILPTLKSSIVNPSNEEAAKAIFEAIALNGIGVLVELSSRIISGVDVKIVTHYAVIEYVKFDSAIYKKTGKFVDSLLIGINMGWGKSYYSYKCSVNSIEYAETSFSIKRLHFLAPQKKFTYTENVPSDYKEYATDAQKQLAIMRRKEFDSLVGKNYEKVRKLNSNPFVKGEVVADGSGELCVIVKANAKDSVGNICHKISYATEAYQEIINAPLQGLNAIVKGLARMKQDYIYTLRPASLFKLYPKDVVTTYFRFSHPNHPKHWAFAFFKKSAVGEYAYSEPTLTNKIGYLGSASGIRITKIYNDGSYDLIVDNLNITTHTAIIVGEDAIVNVESSTSAQFSIGEKAYLKDNDGKYFPIVIKDLTNTSTTRRYYRVVDSNDEQMSVHETSLWKIVATMNLNNY